MPAGKIKNVDVKMGHCYVFLCVFIGLVSRYSLDKLAAQRRNFGPQTEKDLSKSLCLFVQNQKDTDPDAAELSLLHQLLI